MAKSKITIEERKFQLKVKKLLREDRKITFEAISEALNEIQQGAVSYIIPNRVGKRMSPGKMAKLQPSSPTQVTERTGRLIKMLKEKGEWTVTTQRARMGTRYLKGVVKVSEAKNTIYEKYIGTLRADIQDGNPLIGNEVGATKGIDITTGRQVNVFRKVTKQQLAMRFRHETGIRGTKRPFFAPSAEKVIKNMSPLFTSRLARLALI
jgi:hypothetical protein